jgi:hypothetical protein
MNTLLTRVNRFDADCTFDSARKKSVSGHKKNTTVIFVLAMKSCDNVGYIILLNIIHIHIYIIMREVML